jgi:DNA-directed RNA polymerase specialized sigma24 family protein
MAKNYIDNNRFEDLVQIYVSGDTSVQDELFDCFGLLIDRLMSGWAFKVDKEEAKQECFLLILRVLKNFNKDKGKCFNYFTTVILNNLRLIYTKRKKYNERIQSYIEHKTGNFSVSSSPELDELV